MMIRQECNDPMTLSAAKHDGGSGTLFSGGLFSWAEGGGQAGSGVMNPPR
jgi:hypothetical protein